jgi:hypothetical protein
MTRKRRLGEILMEAGLINETQLEAALNSQRTWGGKLGSTLVRMGFVQEEDILRSLSSQLRLPSVDFRKIKIAPDALQTVPLRVAQKYNVIPVAFKEEQARKRVILAMSDPTNLDVVTEIQFQTGVSIRPVVATESSISRAIDRYYRGKPWKDGEGGRGIDLALMNNGEEMVILSRGQEKSISALDGLNTGELLNVLLQVLEEKGVVRREDLEEALHRKS